MSTIQITVNIDEAKLQKIHPLEENLATIIEELIEEYLERRQDEKLKAALEVDAEFLTLTKQLEAVL